MADGRARPGARGPGKPFTPIGRIGGHHAPATQHDFWLWISGSSQDVVFEHARAAVKMLAEVAHAATEQPCFVHRDSRDLTGFIDGSANPMTHEAPEAALIPDGQPGEGGAHVLVHALDPRPRRLRAAADQGAGAGLRPHQADSQSR